MSKILRKAAAQVSSIKSSGGFRALSIVGPRLHWGNSSYIQWSAQMDPYCHILLYQVDRIYSHKECFSQGDHRFLGGYHSKIWLSEQNHHR
jgi:hypothetical protein